MELGLFPLNLVLLPGELVPLHIFEPRYRELIGECLEEEREFGIVLADNDGVRAVGTRAAVTEVLERFPDGRLNIVVGGGERFRVVRTTEGRSFLTAEVEALLDTELQVGAGDVEAALAAFRLVAAAAEEEPDEPEPTELLSFALAARVDLGPERKQELLELRSEPQRLRLVTAVFVRAAEALERARRVREVAGRNGKAR